LSDHTDAVLPTVGFSPPLVTMIFKQWRREFMRHWQAEFQHVGAFA
jgi:hypothetical protein